VSEQAFAGKVQCGFCGREAQGVYYQVGDTVACSRGGRRYQVLAVALTYFSICLNYAPDVVGELFKQAQQEEAAEAAQDGGAPPASADVPAAAPTAPAPATGSGGEAPGLVAALLGLALFAALVIGISLAAPFLGGFQNAIGLLIIGFGLW
jgi:hypothetical protein